MLLVDDRVVLRANAPPEAEYLLFEIADIELRASEPGRVREHGYLTTVGRARTRLEQLGITAALARECANAMQPVLAEAYARGSGVRTVAPHLGALELFQSDTLDATTQTYRGVFMDLPLLAGDLEVPAAGVALQALFLAALLEGEADSTTVFLSTDAWTKHRKPGERTHKRPNVDSVADLPGALAGLARQDPRPLVQEQLARADVIAFLRARADSSPDDSARELYASLERAIAVRHMPERGPLAAEDLWAVETSLDAAHHKGILPRIEALERVHGRTPGTTYLRARASLALRLESPRVIAERVSALALSMTSFQELCLLAAEAWLDAGEPRRAMPYARDLVDAHGLDEGLLLRAQRLLARAVGAAPEEHELQANRLSSASMAAREGAKASSMPPVSAPDPDVPRAWEPAQSRVPTVRGEPGPSMTLPSAMPSPMPSRSRAEAPLLEPPPRPPAGASAAPERAASGRPPASPLRSATAYSSAPPARTSMGAPRSPLSPPPAPPPAEEAASFTVDLPEPDSLRPGTRTPSSKPPHASSNRPPGEGRTFSRRPSRQRMGVVSVETRAPPAYDPRAEPESSQLLAAPAAPREPGSRESAGGGGSRRPAPPASGVQGELHGASLPPFRLENPPPLLIRTPPPPAPEGADDELAEQLSLPRPGRAGRSPQAAPGAVLEARLSFTRLARGLGVDYRLKRGIELRADLSGIEAMQAVLLESFPDHVVRTEEDAYELRRHGALLSEILARRLGAEWIDVSPGELGYWAMLVPPQTRVWPFGRVARLVEMGHRERDLVSYFLELQARASAR